MSTLDNPNMTAAASPGPTILRYGLIGGLIFIAYSLLGNITGFSRPNAGFGMLALNFVISIALYVGVMVMAIRHFRDNENGGWITFGKAFLIGLGVALVIGILNSIFLYVYVTAIDPAYFETVLEETQGMYERLGMSEEQIEQAMERVEGSFTPMRLTIQSIIGTVIFGGIVAAIVGAVMKKNPPEMA